MVDILLDASTLLSYVMLPLTDIPSGPGQSYSTSSQLLSPPSSRFLLPQTLLSRVLENIVLHLETKFDTIFFNYYFISDVLSEVLCILCYYCDSRAYLMQSQSPCL